MLILVLGGTRSGKSEVAEQIAGTFEPPVTYVATGSAGADDPDMVERIARHRARRPATWLTVEAGTDLIDVVRARPEGTMLVDALGTWAATQLDQPPEATAVAAALGCRAGATVVVSEEVGLSVHPVSEPGRRFVDLMGQVNHAVAAVADDVLLVVAGRTLHLERFTRG